jgi:hypothetical protein
MAVVILVSSTPHSAPSLWIPVSEDPVPCDLRGTIKRTGQPKETRRNCKIQFSAPKKGKTAQRSTATYKSKAAPRVSKRQWNVAQR